MTPNEEGYYDFTERREMETKGNYYYLYNNVLFVTLNTGAYPGGNDEENAEDPSVPSASKDNSEAEAMVENFRRTMTAATTEYEGSMTGSSSPTTSPPRRWPSTPPTPTLRTMWTPVLSR